MRIFYMPEYSGRYDDLCIRSAYVLASTCVTTFLIPYFLTFTRENFGGNSEVGEWMKNKTGYPNLVPDLLKGSITIVSAFTPGAYILSSSLTKPNTLNSLCSAAYVFYCSFWFYRYSESADSIVELKDYAAVGVNSAYYVSFYNAVPKDMILDDKTLTMFIVSSTFFGLSLKSFHNTMALCANLTKVYWHNQSGVDTHYSAITTIDTQALDTRLKATSIYVITKSTFEVFEAPAYVKIPVYFLHGAFRGYNKPMNTTLDISKAIVVLTTAFNSFGYTLYDQNPNSGLVSGTTLCELLNTPMRLKLPFTVGLEYIEAVGFRYANDELISEEAMAVLGDYSTDL